MFRQLLLLVGFGGVAALAGALWFTLPDQVDPGRFAALTGDAGRGETIFFAGGCAACHAEEGAENPLLLSGGHELVTDFGTFVVPNISPDLVHGIGTWSLVDFANAMVEGTSPGGDHYFPAFPFGSYTRMADQDVADLWAFLGTLPPSQRADVRHRLTFPFNLRAGVGLWKALYMTSDPIGPGGDVARGQYLVEALGHCGECHTPREGLGGLDLDAWLTGAPNPSGKGRTPGLRPGQLDWAESDIAYYLETGFTPEFDVVGGAMADVVANMAHLSPEDRAAIAAYLKALSPVN
jgi:mono/diheme cytochrome c family protein